MICMIHKLNLRVGDMDLCLVHYTFLKNNPSSGGGYKFNEYALFDRFSRLHIRL